MDELAPPDALQGRALAMAGRLGSVPHASFALTKRLIRQPSRDRVIRYMRSIDEEVQEAWLSPAVQSAVHDYVERTLKK